MKLPKVDLPSNRKFGFFFTAIFLICSFYSYYNSNTAWLFIFVTTSFIFFIVTILKAEVLLPLNKLWMSFGFLLGTIVSPIIMGLIFFGIFTPIAILMRLFGRDELRLRFKKQSSHWVINDNDLQSETFKKQF